jgi:hypothetical protein
LRMTPMLNYAENIAQQRFFWGFSLREVQTAFSQLKESIWGRSSHFRFSRIASNILLEGKTR